ncbi:anthranilate 1,2-dioxygenase ferredoxin subunit AndAb [Massilia aurea]|uniref:anthranilate 1,2-dioxygenase ferredoxin subunit AndAb n=1 Tax=Massilia aurea TaxID=373040 RepID=UPI003462CA0E
MDTWFDVGAADGVGEGEVAAVVAGGQSLALFKLDGELFALRDKCSHGNARLSDGYIEDNCVECPLHQGLIDIRSGAPKSAPITEPVRSFPVRVVAGRVEVDVADVAAGGAVNGASCGPACASAKRELAAVIDSIEKLGHDVAVLRLRLEDGAPLAYVAGQYLDVVLEDGSRRSYSMAAPGGANVLELHIRHMPGGVFTDRVFGSLATGQRLQLDGPAGDFYLRPTTAPVLLLASGTGFAPVKALVEHAIASGNTRPMRLYWGGRQPADLYHDALCRGWAASLAWFEYVPVVSEPAQDSGWSGRTGLVHLAVLDDHADLSAHEVYACGAPQMVAAAQRDFNTLRALPATNFFADAFLSQADLRQRA